MDETERVSHAAYELLLMHLLILEMRREVLGENNPRDGEDNLSYLSATGRGDSHLEEVKPILLRVLEWVIYLARYLKMRCGSAAMLAVLVIRFAVGHNLCCLHHEVIHQQLS